MQLTAQEIIEKDIITNYCGEGIQQQGIDVRIDAIFRLYGEGMIPAHGKTTLPRSVEIESFRSGQPILLEEGYYEVRCVEGCNMPRDCAMYFRHRSSLVRCGVEIMSGQFDAAFKTDHLGFFMHVVRPVYIERFARIAQAIVTETREATEYNGQYQNDKQRKN